MGEAFFWGIVAGSSLILGGLFAYRFSIGRRTLGLIMAFGSGVLISAVAFELVHEAFVTADHEGGVAIGLFAGSAVFYFADSLIDRMGGEDRKHSAEARRPARRWRSCSASCSTASPSRWCSA